MIKDLDLSLLSKPINNVNALKYTAYIERDYEKTLFNDNWKMYFVAAPEVENVVTIINALDDENFSEVTLPNHLEFLGCGNPQYCNYQYPWEGLEDLKVGQLPKINPLAVFIKDFDIDHIEADKDYIFSTNGFESAIYIYVNDQFVGYSTDNFTKTSFLLNNYLVEGKNRITLLVFKYSFATYYTDQDMWRLSGINRDLQFEIISKKRVTNLKNLSFLINNNKDAMASFYFEASNFDNHDSLGIKLISPDNNIIINEQLNKDDIDVNKRFHLNSNIKNCILWSDETPNLYKLELTYYSNNEITDTFTVNVGFRNIVIEDSILKLNGRRLIIKGVNRHGFSATKGRVMTREEIEEDIKLIKKNNFNAIRCSHYPNNHYFYDLCDKYGLLVCDEAAIETHGLWMFNKNNHMVLPGSDNYYKDFTVNRGKAMYYQNRLHPSIIMWSLGNESSSGNNLLALSEFLHKNDITRIIHYESIHSKEYENLSDVSSTMYTLPNFLERKIKKNREKCHILCEYSHGMGNSLGNLDEYVSLTEKYENFALGFIWDFVDQVITIDNKDYVGGDFYEFPHDSNFCADGLVLKDRTVTSKLLIVKYYYSPIKVKINDDNSFTITNNYKFKTTEKLKFVYRLFLESKEIKTQEFNDVIEPGENKTYKFDEFDKNLIGIYEQVDVIYKEDDGIFEKGQIMLSEQKFFTKTFQNLKSLSSISESNFKIFETTSHLTVQLDDLRLVFNIRNSFSNGLSAIVTKDKNFYLQDTVLPTLFRPTTDNDQLLYKYLQSFYFSASKYPCYIPILQRYKIKKEDNQVSITLKYRMLTGIFFKKFKVTYTLDKFKNIKVSFSYRKPLLLPSMPLVGLRFPIKAEYSKFSYEALGPYDNYIDRDKGVLFGQYDSDANSEFVNYSKPQECGNHEKARNVSIKTDGGILEFLSESSPFSFKYLPYDEFEIENARSKKNLTHGKWNYLTICAFNKGVGGDNSWGAPVHRKYRGKYKKYKLSFIIKVKDNN